MIFVDTGAWFAKFVVRDPNHAAVDAWFRSNTERLVTSDYCLDETLTLLLSKAGPALAVRIGEVLFSESLARLHAVSAEQKQRAWALFQQRAAQRWSFTDCTSKVVIDDLGVTATVSLDRHFEAFGIRRWP